MSDRMNVSIKLESRQDGAVQVGEHRGELFRKDRSLYIRYEEPIEGEANAEPIRSLIRYRQGELLITRRGAVESEQLFAVGGKRAGRYRSPFMNFQMETETKQLVLHADGAAAGELAEPPFSIEWKYDLWIDEHLSGRFHIRLYIQGEQ
ncbi:hypothetical protein BBD42_07820 [Paenibacillus sp. BIHB 4019]|uniref:DUF1934 domain-containing protein n=1 Tax=Paenibacillus sp. BIHB 4019 TaxID=1870819 RepID=A0A1B2DFA9_9BACL|nr:DUF1934 domain-containing protein [Paenibacillus sp. BIHB 4019]ANY66376.1 hypothetical protein BBD42_07820 [Paenibacillus sp. BIHB 4019]